MTDFPAKVISPAVGLINAGNQIENRRFTSAIRSDETKEFAFVDRKREIGEASQTTELHGYRIQLQQRSAHVFLRLNLTSPNKPWGG